MNPDTAVPPRLSVVIPFFDEDEAAPALLAELRPVVEGLGTIEVLLIDDGSHDGTGRVLDEVAAAWPAVRVFHFAQNHGQGPALYFGIHRATGDAIALLDGDGQNDPADLPALIAALDEADFVTGIRAKRRDSTLRRFMSRFANAVRSRVLRDGVRDTGCGLKVFRREVRESFVPLRTLYSFLPAMARAAGFRVAERTVAHRARTRGVSKYGLWVMLWRPLVDMLGMAWFIRRRGASPSRIALRDEERTR
jgi:glycosyltransferase involved in cell wall biosynthesis